MAYQHTINIDLNRLRVAPKGTVAGSERNNVIEAVVVRCSVTDESGLVASIDPWFQFTLENVVDFVEFEDMTTLPDRATAEINEWYEQRKPELEASLEAQKVMSVEKKAPWLSE